MHRTNVDFLTNKVHNCEYFQVYNMTENLTFEQYFENNCVQRACFTEFHSIHSRVYQFDMDTMYMYINRTRASLENRYQKAEENSNHCSTNHSNFNHTIMYVNGHYENWEKKNVFRMLDKN
jgi:hypothetical protein